MSLVNDALKRAQSAQRPILPVQRAEFRPVETPAPRPKFGLPVLLLAGVAVFPLLAFLGVRMALHHGDGSDILANAASAAHVATPVQPSQPAPPPAAPPPAAAPEPQSAPEVAESHTPAPAAQTPSVSPAATPTPAPAGATAHTAPPTEATPPPAPKLQSIVFAPNNPSAMINGRVAFVGDKLPEGKVVAISLKSVTLNAGSETIVLTLSE